MGPPVTINAFVQVKEDMRDKKMIMLPYKIMPNYMKHMIRNISVFQRYWMWGILGCKLYAMVGAICGTTSILTMVVIGYDR